MIDTYPPEDEELNGELDNRLAGVLKELLDQERRSVTSASDDRQRELLERIERWEMELNDDEECVRGLRLFPEEEFHTQAFVEAVESGEIVKRAKQNRPQQIELIKRELEPLYS